MVFQLKNETIVIDKIGGLFSHNKIPLKKKKNTCNFQIEGISSKHLFRIAFSGHGIIFRNCYKASFTS